jgi:hypothetical protein
MEHYTQSRISKQAIDKRFNERTKNMLYLILQQVMSKQVACKHSLFKSKSMFTDIRIMDSSEFKVSKKVAASFPGYGGNGREAIAQIQFEYQLFDSKITEFTIGSAIDSDSKAGMKNIDTVPSGSLLLRDLGYFSPKVFNELSRRNLSFISRAKSQWNFYILKNEKFVRLTTAEIIFKLKNQEEKYLDMDVYVGAQELSPVRLVANLLTPEQEKIRLRNKSLNRKLGSDALESIGLNLFVTNVEHTKCNAEAVYELYTLRWQVELIFKTWKSVMQLHKIQAMNAVRLECILLIKLLWVMLNWSILNQLKEFTNTDLSFHKLTHTLQSRSQKITSIIITHKELLCEWLHFLSCRQNEALVFIASCFSHCLCPSAKQGSAYPIVSCVSNSSNLFFIIL